MKTVKMQDSVREERPKDWREEDVTTLEKKRSGFLKSKSSDGVSGRNLKPQDEKEQDKKGEEREKRGKRKEEREEREKKRGERREEIEERRDRRKKKRRKREEREERIEETETARQKDWQTASERDKHARLKQDRRTRGLMGEAEIFPAQPRPCTFHILFWEHLPRKYFSSTLTDVYSRWFYEAKRSNQEYSRVIAIHTLSSRRPITWHRAIPHDSERRHMALSDTT